MLTCQQLQSLLQEIKTLKPQFEKSFAPFTPEMEKDEKRKLLDEAGELKDQMEEKIYELQDNLIDKLAEKINLERQYESQVRILEKMGLLTQFENGKTGIVGIDGQKYPLPSYDDIIERLQTDEKRKLIETKIDQGFKRFLLVPFAMPLASIADKYTNLLLLRRRTGVKSTKGEVLEYGLKLDLPTFITEADRNNAKTKLEYKIKKYKAKSKKGRGGRYKSEILQYLDSGWQFLLLEEKLDIPAEGKEEVISGRQQLPAGKSSADYLKLFQEDPQYNGEQGLTSEAALIYNINFLYKDNIILDSELGVSNFLIGTSIMGQSPLMYFSTRMGWPVVDAMPGDRHYPNTGCRPCVKI